ncbi:MAG: YlxM family DNA-binding protein [Candidatus Gastranaerophilales bacterium]|nr:YlxM family DNA-binding protein [Candidatus Gastranaerophilales bacterium]
MNRIFERALLYDFYGELLTPHQQNIYERAVFEDMSLGEIAEEFKISRQGVHDLVKRCDRSLQEYESKLHLVRRFSEAKEKIKKIVELTDGEKAISTESRMEQIKKLAEELMEEW